MTIIAHLPEGYKSWDEYHIRVRYTRRMIDLSAAEAACRIDFAEYERLLAILTRAEESDLRELNL